MKIIERIDDVHMNIKHWQESLENRILVYGVHCFQLDTSDNILPERDEHRKELACMNDEMKENKKVQWFKDVYVWNKQQEDTTPKAFEL